MQGAIASKGVHALRLKLSLQAEQRHAGADSQMSASHGTVSTCCCCQEAESPAITAWHQLVKQNCLTKLIRSRRAMSLVFSCQCTTCLLSMHQSCICKCCRRTLCILCPQRASTLETSMVGSLEQAWLVYMTTSEHQEAGPYLELRSGGCSQGHQGVHGCAGCSLSAWPSIGGFMGGMAARYQFPSGILGVVQSSIWQQGIPCRWSILRIE